MLQYPCVKYIYHIDYGVIQGFPALRKTTQLKKYDIFSHVFDIANQLLTRHSRHSVKMMNEAFTILNPGSFVGVFSDYGCWNTKKSAYRQLGSKFPRRRTKPNTKRKTESYVFSGFGSGISCGWERKSSTTRRFATSRFWPFIWKTSSVGKDKVNKWEFCWLEITPIVLFVIMIQPIFPSWALAPTYGTIVDSSIFIH